MVVERERSEGRSDRVKRFAAASLFRASGRKSELVRRFVAVGLLRASEDATVECSEALQRTYTASYLYL